MTKRPWTLVGLVAAGIAVVVVPVTYGLSVSGLDSFTKDMLSLLVGVGVGAVALGVWHRLGGGFFQ